MKAVQKSVLIPYEKYKSLLERGSPLESPKGESGTSENTVTENRRVVSHSLKEGMKTENSPEQKGNLQVGASGTESKSSDKKLRYQQRPHWPRPPGIPETFPRKENKSRKKVKWISL